MAPCVPNDLYREAPRSGISLNVVLVTAEGEFNTETWVSSGISYRVEIDSHASNQAQERLVRAVDEVAEIPKVLRAGAAVHRGMTTAGQRVHRRRAGRRR